MKRTNLLSKSRVLLVKIQLLFNPSFRSSVILEDGYQQIVSLNELDHLRVFVNNVVKSLQNQISSVDYADSPETILRKGTSNFLIQKTFTNIFSGDYLCRSFILARVSNSPLWFPLSREMRQEARRLGISISTFICFVLWFTFKMKRVIGTLLGELFTHFTVLKFSNGSKISLNVLDLSLKKGDQEKVPILISFADWFVKMPTDLKEKFWHSHRSSIEFPKIDINSYQTNEIEQEKVIKIFVSLSAITIEMVPFYFLRKIYHQVIARLFSNKIVDVVSKYENSNSVFLVPSNSGIVRPVWTYLHQSLNSEFVYIELSAGLDPNPFMGELLNSDRLNSWQTIYSPTKFRSSSIPASVPFNSTPWTRIPEWSALGENSILDSKNFEKCIAVFDIEPIKNWFGISTLNEIGYNDVGVVSNFLEAVICQAKKLDLIVLHKPKRKIGERRLNEYSTLISTLKRNYPSNYILIPEDTSPKAVIRKTIGTVSMPCTSTAFIAQDLGFPTIFYDSTCLVNPNDPAAMGIAVARDTEELSVWMKSLVNR